MQLGGPSHGTGTRRTGVLSKAADRSIDLLRGDSSGGTVEQAAHGLSGANKRVMPVRIDVTQEQSVVDALAEAERNFGKLHIA